MASLDDGEFWLPPQFLDDDVFDNPYPSNSEKEKEDILFGGLTKKLSLEDSNFPSQNKPSKGWGESTPNGCVCGCKHDGESESDTLELLYAAAAAGELARLRMSQQLLNSTRPEKLCFTPAKHSHLPHLQPSQFHPLKQQQLMKNPQHYHPRAPFPLNRLPANDFTRVVGRSPHTGSGLRSVFLGNPQTKRQSAGTGVFLPLNLRAPAPPPRKKTACSTTVLLPAKVIHALNLNMEDVGPTRVPELHQANFNNGFSSQKRIVKPQQVNNLPSEWTY